MQQIISELKDTPQSRGSGSHTAHETMHTQPEFAAYLHEDIRHQQTMSPETALELILNLKEDDWKEGRRPHGIFEGITKEGKFEELLDSYRQQMLDETERYQPFVKLCNYVFDELKLSNQHDADGKMKGKGKGKGKRRQREEPPKEDSDLCFCRNDPIHILGSHAGRKPDCIGTLRHIMQRGGRKHLDLSRGLKDRSGLALHWYELLMFIEFKMNKKELTGKKEAEQDEQDEELEEQDAKKSSSTRSRSRSSEYENLNIRELI